MNKKILALAMATLVLFAVGCAPSDSGTGNQNPTGEQFVLKATVKSVSDPHHIEVEVIESDYAFGVYWVLTGADTVYLDASGNSITKSDIKVGDTVKITYGGQVMMSYPPQIVAYKIEKQ